MGRIRSRNTKPELLVRRMLHAQGLRFRLHRNDLPGQPDIVMPKHRLAIFVHGCFWHQHPNCRLASKPKSRQDYWGPKLAANVERDAHAAAQLQALGWSIVTIWECHTRNPDKLSAAISEIVDGLVLTTPAKSSE